MPSDLPILYLFKMTFRLSSRDCFGQTELGVNVRGCGSEAIVCCQSPERTALKLYNFNPRILLGSPGWQTAANEAFQVRCGDRFLSSLKQKSLPLPAHLYSTAIHSRWILIWGDLDGVRPLKPGGKRMRLVISSYAKPWKSNFTYTLSLLTFQLC